MNDATISIIAIVVGLIVQALLLAFSLGGLYSKVRSHKEALTEIKENHANDLKDIKLSLQEISRIDAGRLELCRLHGERIAALEKGQEDFGR